MQCSEGQHCQFSPVLPREGRFYACNITVLQDKQMYLESSACWSGPSLSAMRQSKYWPIAAWGRGRWPPCRGVSHHYWISLPARPRKHRVAKSDSALGHSMSLPLWLSSRQWCYISPQRDDYTRFDSFYGGEKTPQIWFKRTASAMRERPGGEKTGRCWFPTSDLTLPKWWGRGSMESKMWMEARRSSVGFT